MKVLLFTLEYPPFKGGVANYYENVARHWPETDSFFVLHNQIPPLGRGEWGVKNFDNLIGKKLISEHGWPKWIPALFYLYNSVKLKKINHVLVGHVLPLGLAVYLVSKITKIKYTVFIHGMDFTYALKSNKKKFITNKILKGAQNVISSNSYVQNLVSEFLGSDKNVYLVTPGVTENKLQTDNYNLSLREKYKLDGKIVLLSLGRLVRRKGFDQVITALPQVLPTVPNLAYVIAGVGPEEDYLRQKAITLKDIVIFLGQLDEEAKWTWLNLCDIFITVSRNINGDFEGFGIVYLEAGLAGKPVIAGNSGGVRDAVINDYTGLLVDPENIDEIAQAIIKLAQNKNLRERFGEQGRGRALKEFGWEEKVRKIYHIILNK